ncbi:hypothetical protein [Microbacterium oleivorans]|uniref:hypothetical protein n=1 Tax=Microbacterium oleivorans TaxID=273677 RepID=UPI00203E9178|nr:hypothetical protein [Microbacterium oleivorans]MCM3695609.1 hypothetical protein [Microbacterium oleivorans]
MTSRALPSLAAAVLALALSACAPAAPNADPGPSSPAPSAATCTADSGVTVIVDGGDLPGADEVALDTCVAADEPIAATDALAAAGVELEGTTEYGDAIVCRVNGQPTADEPVGSTEDPDYVETCESMPAGFAYWGLWVRPSADADWGFAQEGIETLQLAPGESLELLFSLDGEPAAPTS